MEIIFFAIMFLALANSQSAFSTSSPPVASAQKLEKFNNFNNTHFMFPATLKEQKYYTAQIQSLKPEYLQGVTSIEIYNPAKTWFYWRGLYVAGKVKINDYAGNFRYQLLHELSHHYCWKKEKSLNHKGCFYDNPIQKDYYKVNGKYICGTNNQCFN